MSHNLPRGEHSYQHLSLEEANALVAHVRDFGCLPPGWAEECEELHREGVCTVTFTLEDSDQVVAVTTFGAK